jgi:transposase
MNETLFSLPEEEEKCWQSGKGKVRLEKGDRYQVEMHAASLDEMIPAEHRVRIIWAMVELMDMSRFYARVKAIEGEAGRPAIDPRLLVGVWLYATQEGIGSARELARLCEEHLAYRWLMGGLRVNYHSLADFRVDYESELDDLLTQGVAVLMKEGLVKLDRSAQDGMRVRAHAGVRSFHRVAKLEEYLQKAQEQVQKLKEQNKDEDTRPPRVRVAQERAARERVERIKKSLGEIDKIKAKRAKSHKKKGEEKEPRSSSTDPEARFMQMPAGEIRPAYNAQLDIDTESLIIVGVDVVNEIDPGQMDPMLATIYADYGRYPNEHLVDSGFVTKADLEAAFEKGIAIFAPLPTPRRKGQEPAKPHKEDGPGVRAWRERMTTEAAKEIYKERPATIELANAQARNRGLRQFIVCGLHKVRSVLLWFALVHNILQTQNLQKAQNLAGG